MPGALTELGGGVPRLTAIAAGNTDDRGSVLLRDVGGVCDLLFERDAGGERRRKIMQSVVAGGAPLSVVWHEIEQSAATADLLLRVDDATTGAGFGGVMFVEATSELGYRSSQMRGPEVQLKGLPRGVWEVTVKSAGYAPRTVTLDLDKDREHRVMFGDGSPLTGVVSCAEPISAGLQVLARRRDSGRCSVARTDGDGRFTFEGMLPGEYVLSVEAFESKEYALLPVAYPQSYVSERPVNVTVVQGRVTTPIIVPVAAAKTLSIDVVLESGDGLQENARLWSEGLLFSVRNEQGESVFAQGPSAVMGNAMQLRLRLAQGSYEVEVQHLGRILGRRTLIAGQSWRVDAR